MKIFKYQLPFMEVATVTMKENANIIRIDGLEGALWIWAIVDENAKDVDRTFHLFKTGAEMPDNIHEYVYHGCGAIFIQMELMMYVFEHPNNSIGKHTPRVNDFDWKQAAKDKAAQDILSHGSSYYTSEERPDKTKSLADEELSATDVAKMRVQQDG